MSKKAKSDLLLLIASIIWGFAFVAQKAGAVLQPFTYNGCRFLIGFLSLIPIILIFSRREVADKACRTGSPVSPKDENKTLLTGGLVCGIILFIAANLQQFGIYFETDAGKAGFITTLYIVLVPVLGIFLGKKVSLRVWLCVLIGAAGFYLLTMAGKGNGFTLEKGDFFVLLCAVVFSMHILAVDHFAPKCDGVKLSCLQFLVAGILGLIVALLFENPNIKDILDCWMPILYTGVMSSGVGYTLQIVGQRDAEPTTASLILSLESVFAVLAGVIVYREHLGFLEILGCIVIFAAVILSQLPAKDEA